MKIEHIRNTIDAQRGVMLEIIEKQGVLLRFSVPTRHVKRERVISLSLESDTVFQINSKPSHFMMLRIVQSGHVNYPFFEIGHFVLCLLKVYTLLRLNNSTHGMILASEKSLKYT